MPDVDDDAEGEAGGLADEELLEDPVLELVAVADDVGLVVDVTDDDDDAVPWRWRWTTRSRSGCWTVSRLGSSRLS